jgi:hypothetical protein
MLVFILFGLLFIVGIVVFVFSSSKKYEIIGCIFIPIGIIGMIFVLVYIKNPSEEDWVLENEYEIYPYVNFLESPSFAVLDEGKLKIFVKEEDKIKEITSYEIMNVEKSVFRVYTAKLENSPFFLNKQFYKEEVIISNNLINELMLK